MNILEKSKKKTSKGDRLFIEYLSNYLSNSHQLFGFAKLAILKFINFKTKNKINNNILKILNKQFNVSKIIYTNGDIVDLK